MTERVPQLFLSALADLTEWLEAAGVPAMLVGGIAASILGRPRATRDLHSLSHPSSSGAGCSHRPKLTASARASRIRFSSLAARAYCCFDTLSLLSISM